MGWNLGLGGAVPQPTYAPPAVTPPIGDGVYGITNNGRASCDNYLTALDCNISNSVQIGSSGELLLRQCFQDAEPLFAGHLDPTLQGKHQSKTHAQQSRPGKAELQSVLQSRVEVGCTALAADLYLPPFFRMRKPCCSRPMFDPSLAMLVR